MSRAERRRRARQQPQQAIPAAASQEVSATETAKQDPHGWNAMRRFALHVTIATSIFMLMTLPVLFLHLYVKWLTAEGLDTPEVIAIHAAKYLLFAADLYLFGRFVLLAALKAHRELA